MILCCGEALIDMVPETSVSGDPCFVPKVGGAVFNTAVALGRLSSQVALFTGVSRDFFGSQLRQELENSQVKKEHLSYQDGPTTLAFVHLENGHATYTFYTENAADTTLLPENSPSKGFEFNAIFFGGISLCTDPTASTMLDFMQKRSDRSVTMLDPNIRPSFISDEGSYRRRLKKMIALSDILKLSDEDLNWLVPHHQHLQAQIGELVGTSKTLVLITKGPQGAEAFQTGQKISQVSSPKVEIQDTVGAGDTFNAGFLHFLMKNDALTKQYCRSPNLSVLNEALAYATKAASVTVSRKGANSPWQSEM
jgi:fructokinase